MKIAIPTEDGLKICRDINNAEGFLVVTLALGEITDEEFRKKEIQSETDHYSLIKDCAAIIVQKAEDPFCRSLDGIRCITTPEEIISNIIFHYIENEYRKASDTCCCP